MLAPAPHRVAPHAHSLLHLYLCDISLLTPLGAEIERVRAAVNARVSSYQACALPGDAEHSIMFSPIPDAALSCPLPLLLPGLSAPHIRLLKIAASTLGRLPFINELHNSPLFLAGPELYYEKNRVSPLFIDHLIKTTGAAIEPKTSRYFASGRAGLLYALDAAFDYLEHNPKAVVLTGAMDTFYDAKTLGLLASQNRLLGEGVFDGFVPGEGATFLLLTTAHGPTELINRAQLKLARPGLGFEPGHLLSNKPNPAHALSMAVGDALNTAAQPIKKIYTSENGEAYYGREFSVPRLRHATKMIADVPVCRLAEFCGDLGAAFPGAALALAAQDAITSTADSILISASSDAGARAAICVSPV
ncbi:MAG TPA: hypothetical protein PKD17_16195 [Cellvibrionaceae bacterium]|nr:hypothetical protein [Cellvibrionaceae bacterium]HMW73372.1 hypothetical protein [Cellvibrionaceae bacterium]HNG59734.1 hypothetical protein [Cellvibrionaceae bacterium]